MEKRGSFFLLLLVGLFLSACGTSPTTKVGRVQEVSKELPKDLQERFEVKEITPPGATQASKGSAAVSGTPGESSVATVGALPAERKKPSQVVGPRTKRKAKKELEGSGVASTSPRVESGPAVTKAPKEPDKKVEVKLRRPVKDPIWIGERHVMDVTYFGMGGGTLTMDVLPLKMIGDRKVYHFKGHAVSSKVFSLFYRVNDTVESYFDYDGLFSHRLHVVIDESKQSRDALELTDFFKGQTFYWNRWSHVQNGSGESKETAEVPQYCQDTMTALFYMRGLPMKVGEVITFPVISEAKWWEAVITVVGREMLDTPMGRKAAIKLKLDTKLQGVLQKRGDSFLWLTDDDRRFVLRLDAKVKIGTVVISTREILEGAPPQRVAVGAPPSQSAL
jgi:hypothetical protein